MPLSTCPERATHTSPGQRPGKTGAPLSSTLTGCDIGRCVKCGCCTLSGCCEGGVPWYPGRCPGLAYNALSGLRTAGGAHKPDAPTPGQTRPRVNEPARGPSYALSPMPQRGNGIKPRVAAFAPLPWVGRPTHRPQPQRGCGLERRPPDDSAMPLGWGAWITVPSSRQIS
jgi:hypothetical protein